MSKNDTFVVFYLMYKINSIIYIDYKLLKSNPLFTFMNQFDIDNKMGKDSEVESHSDLESIFNTQLIHDPECFAHFDFFNDNIFVELKTRPNTIYKNNKFYHTRKDGSTMEIDTLYFDSTKFRFAFQHNKKCKIKNLNTKQFFIVWKCSGHYFYWEINWGKKDYYIEELNRDFGHGRKQVRDVTNVYTKCLTHIVFA